MLISSYTSVSKSALRKCPWRDTARDIFITQAAPAFSPVPHIINP